MKPEHLLARCFQAGLLAVDPYAAVLASVTLHEHTLTIQNTSYDLNQFDRLIVLGAGKATAAMAQALEERLGDLIDEGLIVVKYQHTRPLSRINLYEAGHPVPDEAGLRATELMLQRFQNLDPRTLVIVLLSGGASALWVAPMLGISLADKQITTQLLLSAGASIQELNAVRQSLSQIKAGRLAQHLTPAKVVNLLISDVLGDDLSVIGSAPCYPLASPYHDPQTIIEKYQLQAALPKTVFEHIQNAQQALEIDSTPDYFIIANLDQALSAVQEKLIQEDIPVRLMPDYLSGEARIAAQQLASYAKKAQMELISGEQLCLLAGGETTVHVTGSGVGGRNQEFALSFALHIQGQEGICCWSAGTDGSDGPNNAAGAWVDGATVKIAQQYYLNAADFLENNDSYHFFQQLDQHSTCQHHIKTGPTGTNVMDIVLVHIKAEIGPE